MGLFVLGWHGPLRARLALDVLSNKESMLSQCIMAKYGDDLWKSDFKRGDSSTWKILCDGASSLNLITRWAVGDGGTIDILKHAWIWELPLCRWPTLFNTNVCSSCRINDFFLTPSSWDFDRLLGAFGPDLADVIAKIPISSSSVDSIELTHQFSGKSTTCLAYAEQFPTSSPRFSWLKHLRLQPRVKLFWWRILWSALPTRAWLTSHRLASNCQCPWGCLDVEDLDHITHKCKQVQDIIAVFDSWGFVLPRISSLEDFLSWCNHNSSTNTKALQLYCLLIYHCWRNRNDKVHGNSAATTTVLAATIFASFAYVYPNQMLEQWVTFQPSGLIATSHWCPPPPGWIKVNVDGALLPNRLASAAFVFRNHLGHVISCGGSSSLHWDSSQMELLALASIHLGAKPFFPDFEGLIVEGDCCNVLNWAHSMFVKKAWTDHHPLKETMCFLLLFQNVIFNVVAENCNMLAHACAHFALQSSLSFLWDDIPSEIAPLFSVFQEDLGPF